MTVFCYRLSGVIKAVTPLHVGSGARRGVIKRCLPFITGAAVRGAVGTALIKVVCKRDKPLINHENCENFDDCVYTRLFGEEFGKTSKVFFRYAYPAHISCTGMFRPAPRTLYRCSNPQCRYTLESFTPPEICKCEGSLKPYTGYRCEVCGQLENLPVSIFRITATAIDRENRSAATVKTEIKEDAAGTIHVLEVVNRNSRFHFEVIIDGNCEAEANILKKIFERALPDEGIGGAKSRGLGKIEVENVKLEAISTSDLEKRADKIDTTRFHVRLASPMLLDGKLLDPSSLTESARRAYSWAMREGKPQLPEIKLKHWAVDSELYSGWRLKENKRRRIESAISAGSMFQFECQEKSRELALGLAALEHYAIGAYKPHGCGQIIIE
ncbi:MAG: RAMP superfamily CRISPR-associated protein [Candidatus Bathyarchaeia archaeon]